MRCILIGLILLSCTEGEKSSDSGMEHTTVDTSEELDTGESDLDSDDVDSGDVEDSGDDEPLTLEEDCAQQRIAVDPGFEDKQIQGVEFIHTLVENPSAVVFLLHGRGGDFEMWRENIENIIVVNELSAKGWISIANTREDENTDEDNIAEIQTLINGLESIGISSDIPKYAIGFSGGGSFVSLLVHDVSLNGVVTYNSKALGFSLEPADTLPPILMFASENDEVIPPSDIITHYDQLDAANAPVDLQFMENTSITQGDFHRIPNVDCSESARIHQTLTEAGILDSQGFQSISPIDSGWQSVLPPSAEELEDDLMWILKVHFATHAFSSREVDRIISFLASPE